MSQILPFYLATSSVFYFTLNVLLDSYEVIFSYLIQDIDTI